MRIIQFVMSVFFCIIILVIQVFSNTETIKGEYKMDRDYKDILTLEAVELIKNDTPLILDVRTKQEYDKGHIKNSKLIPIDELPNRLDEIENYKDKKIFVYCRSGSRSRIALKLMKDKGFRFIYNLKYGIIDWRNNGQQIEK